jgi:large subunit ribosomal protein L4
MNIDVYNQLGEKIKTMRISSQVFGIEVKPEIIHQVVVALLSNLRRSTASTKKRGEVRGGGKKPWPQKGTGRARAGSIRSPLWRGGGVVFGPTTERNYFKKVNKKVKRLALKMALSDKVNHHKLIVLDEIKLEKIKTKEMEKIMKNLPCQKNKTLLILEKKDEKIILSARNLPYVKITLADNLNLLDILKSQYLLTTEAGIKKIQEIYK